MTHIEAAPMWIAGRAESGDATHAVFNPVRPADTASVAPVASRAQVDSALDAARAATTGWAELTVDDRLAAVVAAVEGADDVIDGSALADLLTAENGKVVRESSLDVGSFGLLLDAASELAPEALAPELLEDELGWSRISHEPWGVVAALLPFNWPITLAGLKVLPALIAGNAVVAKPPPSCPSSLLTLLAAVAERLPAGVLSTVAGPEPLGAELVADPRVDLVSFTGGGPVGAAVAAAAGGRLAPTVLELGGNDAAILGPDAVIDQDLAGALVANALLTAGQVCMAIKRVYVHRSALPALVEALVTECSAMVVGDGADEETSLGPVHTAAARDRALAMVAEAEALGAVVHRCGSIRSGDADRGGHLLLPTIVVDPPSHAAVVAQEQFAPIIPVIPYDNPGEAIAAANNTAYGLCGSLWGFPGDEASALAARLECGTVFIDDHGMFSVDLRAPFGGWKSSGYGRELGAAGLVELTRTKTVTCRSLT